MAKKKEQQVLICFDDNWADEMDIQGFTIMDENDWKFIKKKLQAYKNTIHIGFGTNEDNEYENGNAFLETLNVEKISEEEVNAISKFFGYSYGNTSFIYAFEQMADEEEEEDDEVEA